jgi:hypothetical protein
MLSQAQLVEIKSRIESATGASTPEREDAAALLAEVARLQRSVDAFSENVNTKLAVLEEDMIKLEGENGRLRSVCESTYFERDACIGLIARMATQMGIPAGTLNNRVVVDLPSGQVSWDYLDSEAHLFEWLPTYAQSLQEQSVRDIYAKVMNPSFDSNPALSLNV